MSVNKYISSNLNKNSQQYNWSEFEIKYSIQIRILDKNQIN